MKITELIKGICELVDHEQNVRPSYHDFVAAIRFVSSISQDIIDKLPFASVSTVDGGDIRIEWRISSAIEVRLIFPGLEKVNPYIYYEVKNNYGVIEDANVESFEKLLSKIGILALLYFY